jgi:hypothetical protein
MDSRPMTCSETRTVYGLRLKLETRAARTRILWDTPTSVRTPSADTGESRGIVTRFCASCGSPLAPDARFCTSCGTPTPLPPAESVVPTVGSQMSAWSPSSAPLPASPPSVVRPSGPQLPTGVRPAGGPSPQPDHSPARWIIPLALLVIVVLLVGVGVVLSSGTHKRAVAGSSTTPTVPSGPRSSDPSGPSSSAGSATASEATGTPQRSGTPTASLAAQQARTVDALLRRSATARAAITAALNAIGKCEVTARDRAALQQAISTRQGLEQELSSTTFSGLPAGQQMAAHLRQAWELSISADEKYLGWSYSQAACLGSTEKDPNQVAGDDLSGRATKAKKAFLALWNPIAARHHLPKRVDFEI